MTPAEQRILANVLAVARGRLTKASHAAIVVTTESRGHCHWRKPCGPKCLEVNAAIRDAQALLDLECAAEPVQQVMAMEAV